LLAKMTRERKTGRRRIAEAVGIGLLLPIILPLALLGLTFHWIHQLLLYVLLWCLWLPKGKDALFVYSDSPIWRDYMTQEILPLLKSRAVVLNWSERSSWPKWSFVVHVFRSFNGGREFNPMVVLFRPFHRAMYFRFWAPFKERKHGHSAAVDALTRELRLCLLDTSADLTDPRPPV
jgi:hypothetical protein